MNVEITQSIQRLYRRLSPMPIVCGLLAISVACSKKEAPPPPPPEVEVAEATQKDVPIYIELVGATLGSEDVEIRARVEGYLSSMSFTEGSFVKKGQVLYKIDPQPFQAALAQAQANFETARARLEKTNNDVARYKPLAEQKAVSQQELDNALSAQEAARFQVTAYDAVVAKTKLDLAYTTITSPVDGLIGTTQRKVGSLVGRGENTLLNTISQTHPILFRCAIAEAEYLRLARQGTDRAALEKQYGVELILADGTVHPYKGRLEAVERAVDPTTGTLTGQFSFPNPQRILRPSQYGKARFVTDVKHDAVLIPQRAVQAVLIANVADEEPHPRVGELARHLGLLQLIAAEYRHGADVFLLENAADEGLAEGAGAPSDQN